METKLEMIYEILPKHTIISNTRAIKIIMEKMNTSFSESRDLLEDFQRTSKFNIQTFEGKLEGDVRVFEGYRFLIRGVKL